MNRLLTADEAKEFVQARVGADCVVGTWLRYAGIPLIVVSVHCDQLYCKSAEGRSLFDVQSAKEPLFDARALVGLAWAARNMECYLRIIRARITLGMVRSLP